MTIHPPDQARDGLFEWGGRLHGAWLCCGTCWGGVLAGRDRAFLSAERERIAVAIERAAADEGYAYGGVGFGRIAARIARTNPEETP